MAGKNNDIISMKQYKNKGSWNIGVFLFGIIFVYLFVTVIAYLAQDKVSVYEVREGSILKDTSFTGLIVRDETVYYAEADGYINYFLPSGSKVGINNPVYTISPDALPTVEAQEENEGVSVTNDDWGNILAETQSFHENYSSQSFDAAYRLQQSVTDTLQSHTSQNRVAQLSGILQSELAETMTVVGAQDDGIIEYAVDGYEDMDLDSITDEQILKHDYKKTEHANNTKISSGSPVFKLITDEKWTLIIKLTPEMEATFREMEMDGSAVKIRFLKDDEEQWATFQILNRGKEDAYGYLTFSSGMVRYASDRYLDIELILMDESGLKVPKSSVVTKDFYVIPEGYLTTGGASSETGVLRKPSSDKATRFEPVEVFYHDSEGGTVYIDTESLDEGDTLVMAESSESLTVGKKEPLTGVYNVNKGYAVFKRVEILCESEEYYIVEEGSSYGLSNYDRIALDGSMVQENQIIN